MSLLSTNKLANDILYREDLAGVVQPYDADTAKYDDTTANFTGTLQNGGSNVLVDTDVSTTLQPYSSTTADYADATANFTGTLQNSGSNVLVDSDVGTTVQELLVSGTNIKTFNGESLLGSEDIVINTDKNIDGGASDSIFTSDDFVIDCGSSI